MDITWRHLLMLNDTGEGGIMRDTASIASEMEEDEIIVVNHQPHTRRGRVERRKEDVMKKERNNQSRLNSALAATL